MCMNIREVLIKKLCIDQELDYYKDEKGRYSYSGIILPGSRFLSFDELNKPGSPVVVDMPKNVEEIGVIRVEWKYRLEWKLNLHEWKDEELEVNGIKVMASIESIYLNKNDGKYRYTVSLLPRRATGKLLESLKIGILTTAFKGHIFKESKFNKLRNSILDVVRRSRPGNGSVVVYSPSSDSDIYLGPYSESSMSDALDIIEDELDAGRILFSYQPIRLYIHNEDKNI